MSLNFGKTFCVTLLLLALSEGNPALGAEARKSPYPILP